MKTISKIPESREQEHKKWNCQFGFTDSTWRSHFLPELDNEDTIPTIEDARRTIALINSIPAFKDKQCAFLRFKVKRPIQAFDDIRIDSQEFDDVLFDFHEDGTYQITINGTVQPDN